MDRIDKDEELVCPLCGRRLFWMPVSHIYACEHCQQSYSERNGVYMKKKRKSTAEKSSAVGNAAKLREALEKIAYYDKDDANMDDPYCADGRICADIARQALSAPPRNCDLARDWMRDLYAHFKPPASIKREMPPEWVDAVMAFCRWLVAPATEKKGGTK